MHRLTIPARDAARRSLLRFLSDCFRFLAKQCSCCQSAESTVAAAVSTSAASRSLNLSRQLLRDVRAVFAQRGVSDLSWPSGRAENNADLLVRFRKAEHDPEVATKLARFDRWAHEQRARIAGGDL